MRVILINPQRNRKDQLGELANYVPLNVPFGIGYLAAYLLKNGKDVKIIDEEITPVIYSMLTDSVKGASGPYIFGLSCLTANIGRGFKIAKMIKEIYSDSIVIFGGIHPTVMPEEVLNTGVVDIVVRNEGEITLCKLYELIESGKDYTDILGISYIQDGMIKHNSSAPLIDMNELPVFPFFLFEKYKARYNFGFLLTSRGCPYDCIFCSQRTISGRSYRFLSINRVVETLDIMINKYRQRYIVFSDDNFIVNKKRTIEVCNAIVENGFYKKATFTCQARGDSIDGEILDYLKGANFSGISFGIETASDRLMHILRKGEKVQDNIDAVKIAKRYGFKVSGTFILGLPTETRAERKMAYRMAKSLDLDYVRFNNATPYPGTELYKIALDERRLNIGEEWQNLNACGTLIGGMERELAYVPTTCTEEELMVDIFWYNIFYSLRPLRVLRLLFDKATDTGGWFMPPEKWYLKWEEWNNLTRLFISFLFRIIRMSFYSIKIKLSL